MKSEEESNSRKRVVFPFDLEEKDKRRRSEHDEFSEETVFYCCVQVLMYKCGCERDAQSGCVERENRKPVSLRPELGACVRDGECQPPQYSPRCGEFSSSVT